NRPAFVFGVAFVAKTDVAFAFKPDAILAGAFKG
ncbi:MAG: hypothetical protein ACJAVT_002270, partial [Yoonia sp.]